MSRAEMDQENEVLKERLSTLTKALHEEALLAEKTATVLEQAKNVAAAAGTKDGKAPSEAYCNRIAEADPVYVKLREENVQLKTKSRMAMDHVEYQRNRVRIAIAAFETTRE